MYVQHLDAEKLVQAYGVDLQLLYPWEGVVEPPFGAAWAILAPGDSTKHHQHQELETFFIVRGEGEMTVDGESTPVRPGSVIYQRPFHEHTLTNTSDVEDLMFLTVWWEDRKVWLGDEERQQRPSRERVMITAAPPTPNGDLHLGHLSGPYLSADIYKRYLAIRGVEGYYACGSDDHCMYVERMGESQGMTGHQAADHFTAQITESLEAAGIDMDVFMNPRTSPHFAPRVQDFFHRLYRAGALEEREAPAPFCEPCGRYLHEADVAGGCPHCGVGLTGNTCEDCGRINDCVDLVDARCTACGTTASRRPFKRLVFPLSRHADALRRYHRTVAMSPRLRAFCESVIADGLPDVAISHVSGWGIPVPLDDAGQDAPSDPAFREQTLYVWFEMAPRYFAYAQHLNELSGDADASDFRSFWRADDAEIVQFFGFDNSFYYALLLPALWLAYDPELGLPTSFVCNEFYRLDGEKFSTSRDHRILGRTMAAAVPRDVMRFYLAYSCPEREETNFTVDDFEQTVERELRRGWSVWLERLKDKVQKEFDGAVPSTGDWTPEHRRFFRRLQQLIAETAEAYDPATFSPQRATRVLCELVRVARRFGMAEDHWREVPERSQERRTAVALELVAAKMLAILAAPIMPELSARLWRELGYRSPVDRGTWEAEPTWVPAGQQIGDLGIDDSIPRVQNLLGAAIAEGKDDVVVPAQVVSV